MMKKQTAEGIHSTPGSYSGLREVNANVMVMWSWSRRDRNGRSAPRVWTGRKQKNLTD